MKTYEDGIKVGRQQALEWITSEFTDRDVVDAIKATGAWHGFGLGFEAGKCDALKHTAGLVEAYDYGYSEGMRDTRRMELPELVKKLREEMLR